MSRGRALHCCEGLSHRDAPATIPGPEPPGAPQPVPQMPRAGRTPTSLQLKLSGLGAPGSSLCLPPLTWGWVVTITRELSSKGQWQRGCACSGCPGWARAGRGPSCPRHAATGLVPPRAADGLTPDRAPAPSLLTWKEGPSGVAGRRAGGRGSGPQRGRLGEAGRHGGGLHDGGLRKS